MKILFLVHFFPPTHTAGAENYTFDLARALVGEGHQVYVLCAGTWDSGENYWNGYTDETYAGIHVRRLHLCWYKMADPNGYLYDNPLTAGHLQAWLSEIRPDVVHVTSCYTLSASVIHVCKDAGLPVVVTLVDFWFLCPRLTLLRPDNTLCDGKTTPWECLRCLLRNAKAYRWPRKVLPEAATARLLTLVSKHTFLSRQRGLRGMCLDMDHRKMYLSHILRVVDCLIVPSEFLREMYASVIPDLDRIRVIPFSIDTSWLPEVGPQTEVRGIRFGSISHLAPIKGIHLAVEAYKRLSAECGASLSIWGELPEASPYAKQLRALSSGVQGISFQGRFAPDQLGKVLSQVDVVLVPSLWYENNPLVIQTAFAAGRPVIATNLGGMSSLVQHEVNGLLFERDNVADLSRQMQRIIQEPALLARLRSGIPPVKAIGQDVHEVAAIYGQFKGQKRPLQRLMET